MAASWRGRGICKGANWIPWEPHGLNQISRHRGPSAQIIFSPVFSLLAGDFSSRGVVGARMI